MQPKVKRVLCWLLWTSVGISVCNIPVIFLGHMSIPVANLLSIRIVFLAAIIGRPEILLIDGLLFTAVLLTTVKIKKGGIGLPCFCAAVYFADLALAVPLLAEDFSRNCVNSIAISSAAMDIALIALFAQYLVGRFREKRGEIAG